jgi:hypothetical protein
MLKSMKNIKHNINIGTYLKLQVFLKRKSSGLKVKIPKYIKNYLTKLLILNI